MFEVNFAIAVEKEVAANTISMIYQYTWSAAHRVVGAILRGCKEERS